MKKILVPIDSSNHSKRVLIKARELGRVFNSEITILNVASFTDEDFYKGYDKSQNEYSTTIVKSREILLKSAKDGFQDYPGIVNTLYKVGNVADVILDTAKEGDYDLIIMGSRGLGTFSRTLLGSVSNNVLNHSDISVLIIK